MTEKEFQNFMSKEEFRTQGKMAYGNVEGYPVLIKKMIGSALELRFYLEEEPWKLIREEMLEFARLYKSSVYFQKPHMIWKLRLGEREYTRFEELLQGIVRIFKKKSICYPKHCAICGEEGADSYAVIDEGNRPIHRDCLQNQLTVTRQRKAEGSYLLGILGALLGCLLGSVPCIVSLLLFHKTFCVLFLFLPPGIYYGCKWLHGKMNWFVLGLSVVLSLASVYVMEFIVRIQYNLQEQGLPYTLHYGLEVLEKLLQYPGIWGIVNRSAGLNFLFAFVGICINWELISRTSLKAEANVVDVINTINYRKP